MLTTKDDVMLSFLPLSHTLERTVGYYVAIMSGATIAYNRSLKKLSDDLAEIKPTGLITVPKIFETSYSMIKEKLETASTFQRWLFNTTVNIGWQKFEHRQGRGAWSISFLLWPLLDYLVASKVRDRFGGRLKMVIVGGAPCPPAVSRVFISVGIELLQGYGLTESSPVISVNTKEENRPETIGLPTARC